MKTVNTSDAVGMVLCHDISCIVKDGFKGVAFKKGHIITSDDVPELLKLGKDHIYVFEDHPDMLHENDAASRLANLICGDNIEFSDVREGKINFHSSIDGLLKIDVDALLNLNMLDEIIAATIHTNRVVKTGDILGGTRVIPLMIDESKIVEAENITKSKIINVLPIHPRKTAIITTGSEVYYKRIVDTFTPIVTEKANSLGCEVIKHVTLPDDTNLISKAIKDSLDEGCTLILCTGGMSVDPDDLTPSAIKSVADEVVTYGTPVLPGAMLLLAYYKDSIIMGLPGCVMHGNITMLDLILPRLLSGEKLNKRDIAQYGHGGLCEKCKVCTYPACSFGK